MDLRFPSHWLVTPAKGLSAFSLLLCSIAYTIDYGGSDAAIYTAC